MRIPSKALISLEIEPYILRYLPCSCRSGQSGPSLPTSEYPLLPSGYPYPPFYPPLQRDCVMHKFPTPGRGWGYST